MRHTLALLALACASCGDRRAPEPSGSGAAEVLDASAADYVGKHLVLYDLRARYEDNLSGARVPGVTFKIKNNGSRTLRTVKVRVVFKDAEGRAITEREYSPVLYATGTAALFGSGDNRPLLPGYIWQMESGKFFAANAVPSEWKEGAASASISEIEFAAGDGSSGH